MITLNDYLKYSRKLNQKSSQDMALTLGVSKRTLQKLEAGETIRFSITKSVLESTRFNHWDETLLKEKEKTLKTFFRHILYAKYLDATPLAINFVEQEEDFNHSPLIIVYTLYLWVYVIHTQNPIIDIDDYYHKLVLLEPYMNDKLKEFFLVEKTGYYFVKGELKKSFSHFAESMTMIEDNHLKALNYFLVGASGVNEIQSIDQSIHYLTLAHTIFNEYGNYLRANRCNAFLQVAYIHSRRYQEFLDLYKDKETYLHKDEEHERITAFIEGNLARYYVITEKYDKACEVLRQHPFPSSINYFLYLVAAYQSRSDNDLNQLLTMKDLEALLINAHHKLFLTALNKYQTNQDITAFIQAIKEVVMAADKANDYIAYITLNPILIEGLKKAKKYKEAHFYASKELDLLRQFH